MSYKTIHTETRDAIGILTLNRPDRFNTFSSQLAAELNTSLQEMDKNAEVFARLCTTEDAAEAVAAFTGKRKLQWKEC